MSKNFDADIAYKSLQIEEIPLLTREFFDQLPVLITAQLVDEFRGSLTARLDGVKESPVVKLSDKQAAGFRVARENAEKLSGLKVGPSTFADVYAVLNKDILEAENQTDETVKEQNEVFVIFFLKRAITGHIKKIQIVLDLPTNLINGVEDTELIDALNARGAELYLDN